MRAITLALVGIALTSCTPRVPSMPHPTGPEIKCQVYGGPFCYPPLHADPLDQQCRGPRIHKPKLPKLA